MPSSARTTSRSTTAGSASVIPQGTPAENAVPALAPFADPGPLGLAAFALTTFVLSFANAGLIPGAGAAVLGLAIFYGGLGQIIAGIWEFANKNTFGATAFCSYGGFWLAFWYLVSSKGDVAAGGGGVGIFLIAFGIFTLYMTVAALKTNLALIAVFAFLTLTFFALGIGAAAGAEGLSRLGGWLGIITALLAWYTSFAIVTNSTFKRVVLPLYPRA
jgi:succinate-acetate transporter protein